MIKNVGRLGDIHEIMRKFADDGARNTTTDGKVAGKA